MPTFYKPGTRKGNKTIIVRGTIAGKEYEYPTETLNKGAAKASWERFRAARLAERDATPTKATARFGDAVSMYRMARNLTRNEGRYLSKIEHRLGNYLLSAVTPAVAIEAGADLYPKAKPQTVNRQAIRPIAAVMHYAAENSLCEYRRFRLLEEEEPKRVIAYPDQVIQLARMSKGPLRVLLLTLAHQGWRITETLMIRREWHDHENSRVRRWVSKSKKWRWAALDPAVSSFWNRLPVRADGYIFPWRDRHDVYKGLRKLGSDMPYTPHMSRRGFATALIEEGADLKSIMVAAQWQDVKSVLPYADANLEQVRKTLNKIRTKNRGKNRKAS